MKLNEFVEVMCAAHLSSYVESPFRDRGGIMVVGAPATLKSTITFVLDRAYNDVVALSDANTKGLVALRDAIASGSIRTLIFPELAKLYQRHEMVASNLEGTLNALAGEGFAAASFEDQRVNSIKARATIIGALTPATQRKMFPHWEESGFNRRFLWPLVRLQNPAALEEAVIDWKLIDLNVGSVPRAPLDGAKIPNLTTSDERRQLFRWTKYQPGSNHALQMQLLSKIVSVLRWHYKLTKDRRDAMTTVGSFCQALGKEGTELVFDQKRRKGHKVRVSPHRAAQVLGKHRANVAKQKAKKGKKR